MIPTRSGIVNGFAKSNKQPCGERASRYRTMGVFRGKDAASMDDADTRALRRGVRGVAGE